MKKRNWKLWIQKAGIRALKTFAQTAGSLITVGAVLSEIDWAYVASAAAVAAIYSLVTSVAGIPEVDQLPAENQTEAIEEEA